MIADVVAMAKVKRCSAAVYLDKNVCPLQSCASLMETILNLIKNLGLCPCGGHDNNDDKWFVYQEKSNTRVWHSTRASTGASTQAHLAL